MLSQCCICKIVEAVKCPKCGEHVEKINDYVFKDKGSYRCSYGHEFTAMEGGISHGYCPPCLANRIAAIKLTVRRGGGSESIPSVPQGEDSMEKDRRYL